MFHKIVTPSFRFNSRLQEELIPIQAHVDHSGVLKFMECSVVEPNVIGVRLWLTFSYHD